MVQGFIVEEGQTVKQIGKIIYMLKDNIFYKKAISKPSKYLIVTLASLAV